jgi:hypothetical protein
MIEKKIVLFHLHRNCVGFIPRILVASLTDAAQEKRKRAGDVAHW